MRLGMGRFVLLLILVSPLCAGVAAATPEPAPALEARQTILEANRSLVKKGWQPAPKQSPSPEERRWSAVPLSSLSTCSGTGVVSVGLIIRRTISVCRWSQSPAIQANHRWAASHAGGDLRVEFFSSPVLVSLPACSMVWVRSKMQTFDMIDLKSQHRKVIWHGFVIG